MGVVVSFSRSAEPARRVTVAETADGRTAAILFFTGVRYLSPDDAALYLREHDVPSPAKKRRRSPRVAKPAAAELLAQA